MPTCLKHADTPIFPATLPPSPAPSCADLPQTRRYAHFSRHTPTFSCAILRRPASSCANLPSVLSLSRRPALPAILMRHPAPTSLPVHAISPAITAPASPPAYPYLRLLPALLPAIPPRDTTHPTYRTRDHTSISSRHPPYPRLCVHFFPPSACAILQLSCEAAIPLRRSVSGRCRIRSEKTQARMES